METYIGGWRVVVGTNSVTLRRPGNYGIIHDAVIYPRDGERFSGSTGITAAEEYIRGQSKPTAPASN